MGPAPALRVIHHLWIGPTSILSIDKQTAVTRALSEFSRPHETIRKTSAMALGLTDHIWTIGELIEACLSNAPKGPRKVHRRFTVIQSGRED